MCADISSDAAADASSDAAADASSDAAASQLALVLVNEARQLLL